MTWRRMKNQQRLTIIAVQSKPWLVTPTIKNSGTYSERNFPTYLFLPDRGKQSDWRDCSLCELPIISFPCWRIGDSTDLKFQKLPFHYTYKNEGTRNFTLFISLCIKGNRTIIIIINIIINCVRLSFVR